MKRYLPILLALVIFSEITLSTFAQIVPPIGGALNSTVSAQVGEFYLNLSGWISPFASVVLYSDGIFLRATVADQYGNFSISGVLIKSGFSSFCLDAIDFRRIGESYTCFNIPPATGSVTMTDIFLPPTLALQKNEIAEGSSTLAFGYTMPGALVTLYLSNGEKLTTYADSTGFYEFVIKDLKAGTYSVYARAVYKNKQSLSPTKKLQLKSLSWWEQFLAFLKDLWNKILKFLTNLALGPLWLAIPSIILIIILILKIWPEKFTFIYTNKVIVFFTELLRKPKKNLHHSWWMGY